MNDPGLSFLVSCGLHAALLFGTAGFFSQPPRYDVQPGSGGIEVSLVAAPAKPAKSNVAAVSKPAPTPVEEAGLEPIAQEVLPPTTGEESEADALDEKDQLVSAKIGDGSSPVPGQDATTFYLPGGASGTGGRLKNPAPAYPYQAIRQGQQGVVVLEVLVDKNGRPASVGIHESSGFPLLDQSALWTVRRWKFDPAHVGFLPVNARVRVPIRFILDERLKGLRE